MKNASLYAISPVDGRYKRHTESLSEYFSEFGLIKYRVRVEIEYLIALSGTGIPQLDELGPESYEDLRSIYRNFDETNALEIKEIEKTTNHDVKAVEYFIKERMDDLGLSAYKEFVHFGLTSQDINNTAIPLSIREALNEQVLPLLNRQVDMIDELSRQWADIPMLARTHGQPASPTRLGKELQVFVVRLREQMSLLHQIPVAAKFGGATGNLNAHHVAYPDTDWNGFAFDFVEKILGLKRSYPTTQIEHYDHLAAIFDALKRINTIFIDFARDIWQYISMHYFHQKILKGEVGSSAMPHKVNPIDFENAEGNLGIANAFYEHLSSKLPVSRLQRDLTDSTVLRNVGVPLGHSMIAFRSLEKGMSKLEINKLAIEKDLEDNWAVVAEAIQTVLRREGFPKPYEALKALTRKNEKITQETILSFIDTLDIDNAVKDELRKISPYNYTGL